ncbi:MAG: hypothetical protein JWQ35_1424 [Bacteriovoracaceae bacterium]|nr:hypothetical protein [Bacteriovoracaceae bacterium]
MEGIFSLTFLILKFYRSGNFEKAKERILERGLLVNELEQCEKELKKKPELAGAHWIAQMALIQKMNEEIELLTEKSRAEIGQQYEVLQNAKVNIIQSHDLDPRGNRLEAKG